ncbi:Alpha/beta hydrolase [Rhodococcus jostii]|uniref:Alpha/beta hydrolase n=1 Tax=Rhodococcus jostii TaxID=132919 RepID=A0A1H4YFY7_RHOJO|nr:Alpha/beta hydrolase [Rhodococcus jostii]
MNLRDIARWDTGALQAVQRSLSARLATIGFVQDRLADIGRLPTWHADAADAARRRFRIAADDLTGEAAAIAVVERLTREMVDAVTHLQTELDGLREAAVAHGMALSDNGDVADVPGPAVDASAAARRDELRAAARALILQAEDLVADAAAVLTRAADGELEPGEVEHAGSGLSAPAPPSNGSPLDNREYWDALPDAQRREVIERHPDWIGNRDGIPSAVRHEANVGRFDDERSRWEAERDRLRESLDHNGFGGAFTDDDAALWYAEQKLRDLGDLEKLVRDNPDGRLILLDLQSGERTMAAFALGDPDTADHISVTTPGIDTTVASLGGMTEEAKALKSETERQLDIAGRTGETVSTIAWLGYQPPTTTGPGNYDVPFLDQNLGRGWLLDSWQSDRATAGAPKLASFYDGLDVASQKPDPHITALGHSYGSFTQGLALQDPGPGQPVDDAVFYGSPGFHANDESDLGLAPGHGFVMRAHDDPIAVVDGFDTLGPDPVQTDLEQLSVREATTPTACGGKTPTGTASTHGPAAPANCGRPATTWP